MDFGIGFLSNNVMLPILDFFYGIVPSYGLAIIALTLVIRFALYPLSSGSLRNMRQMKVAQPAMQKRQQEIKERYKNDPVKQQEELSKVFQEFGNPLAGCLPLIIQMPVLFALFATLRGSPFADVTYSVNLQILPQEQVTQIQPQAFATPPHNIYVADGVHFPVIALLPGGSQLPVGEKTTLDFQTSSGKSFKDLQAEYSETQLKPHWKVTKGEDRVRLDESGALEALRPGDVTLQGIIPGIASQKGFLFIDALGHVGAFDSDLSGTAEDGSFKINWGAIHWDIVGMVVAFGVSTWINQLISGQQGAGANPQQANMNKIMPIMLSGMFLFFPLPAGVLLYMLIANIFQTFQGFILAREPLPENLQKLVEVEQKVKEKETETSKERQALPFEPGRSKKKASESR